MQEKDATKIAEAYDKMDDQQKAYLTGYVEGAADQQNADNRQQEKEEERA